MLDIFSSKCNPIEKFKRDSPERSIFSILQEKRNFQFFNKPQIKLCENSSIIKTNKILSTGLNDLNFKKVKEDSSCSIAKENVNKSFNFYNFENVKSINLDCEELLESEKSK